MKRECGGWHREASISRSFGEICNRAPEQHHTLAVSGCIHALVLIALAIQHVGLVSRPSSAGWVVEPMIAVGHHIPDLQAATAPAITALGTATLTAIQPQIRTASLTGIAPRHSLRKITLPDRKSVAGASAETASGSSPLEAAQSVAPPQDRATITAFEERISAAIEAAKFYPARARQLRREGRAIVTLVYCNGIVGNVRLQQSAGNPDLDAGALRAVRQARYPMPPRALIGHIFELSLPIAFSLTEQIPG